MTSQHDQSLHPAAPTCTTMSEADLVRDFEQARRRHRAMWAAGDFTRVAEQHRGERRGGRGGSQPSQAPRG